MARAIQTLIVTDDHNRELWRKPFADMFNATATPEYLVANRKVALEDIDGDGHAELLYSYWPANAKGNTSLFCFSHDGIEKWRFVPGKAVRSRQAEFSPNYEGIDFRLLPAAMDGSRGIVILAHNSPRFPSQVARLSPKDGRLLGEYWHSGHLGYIEITDLEGDGRPEAILAGISNGYKSATLLVLDPADLGGCSYEEDADYQLLGFGSGRERARILFPRSCMSRKFDEYSTVGKMAIGNDLIELEVFVHQKASLFYRLTRRLELREVLITDPFRTTHREFEASGQLDHTLTKLEVNELHNLRILKPLNP